MKGVRKQRYYNPRFKLDSLRKLSLLELAELKYQISKDMDYCKGTSGYYSLSSYAEKINKIVEEKTL